MSLLNPDLVQGYKEHTGPPPTYTAPGSTLWTKNKQSNGRFAVERGSDGRFRLRSLHRVRALDLVGQTDVFPGQTVTFPSPQFNLFFTDDREYTAIVPEAGDDAIFDFRAVAAALSGNRFVNFSANGVFLGRVFRFNGQDGSLSTDQIVVPRQTWNSQVLAGLTEDVPVTFAMEPISSFGERADQMSFILSYTDTGSTAHNFVNEEVAFPHRAPGIERRGDGRFQPVGIIKPIEAFGARVTRGVVWGIVDDPRDVQFRFWNFRTPMPEVGSEFPELGPSGRFVFVLPFETPDLVEGVFGSYPVVCGLPV